MGLLDKLLDVTVKQRRPGAHAAHRIALKVIRAYNNRDVEISSDGEAWLIERLASLRPAGLVAVDVGANLGEWTAEVLKQPATTRLIAYEAVPATYAQLAASTADPRAELINAALSDQPGTLQMQQVPDAPEYASLHADYAGKAVTTVSVDARMGDAEMDRLGIAHIDLLKVDTEGHDHAVLQGFARALSTGAIDVIQFEYNYTTLIAGKSLKAFFDLLTPAYLVCRLLPRGLEACAYHPSLDNFAQSNWVAVRRDLIDAALVRDLAIRPVHGLVRQQLEQELDEDETLRKLILG